MSPPNGAKVALAVGAGYLLGRTRKMRLALMLASAGMTGKFRTKPTDVLADGLQALGASDELMQLTDQLRGQALNAAKAAALATAINGVNALNERLQRAPLAEAGDIVEDVGDTVETVGADVGDTVGDVGDTLGKSVKSVSGLLRGGAPTAEEDEEADLYEDEVIDEDDAEPADEEPQPPPRKRRATPKPTAPRASVRRSARAATADEPQARAVRRKPATTRAPVRRGR
ncbi:hypothetical protein A5653_18265 [Mycobacterium colombiense]|uniref:DNA primase n=1 Tax=Mycobacterium colombiense TaxID=339268 RepID=A0A853LWK1_9MYCO|nr:hypothetical protein [Mycobacterium colombiense]OBJ19860.1 hypothetical protein A5623_12945 [Mycobacterium colombiense]OBJ37233.1 hypothetical protein A5620_01535 [Mycobacterium colombiense]OBJ58186.1 hypothetical protein A5628_14150 [Mycobacterium colombiense]OBK66865.1 hypothetical protein A5653_18265 [Mycobacterium colombiense]